MTAKSDFTEQEWKTVLEGPPTAGMIVLLAQRGGTFRETFAMGKAYAEARQQHGESELLDEIVSAKPEVDRAKHGSLEEFKDSGLEHLRQAIGLLEQRATPQEIDDYRRFVRGLAEEVARAHREDGVDVSPPERAAIAEIGAALGMAGPG